MTAFWDVDTSAQEAYEANLAAILDRLTRVHGFPLSEEDRVGVEYVYHAFYWFGPSITYSSSNPTRSVRGSQTTYADLMAAVDAEGVPRSFLASEDAFRVVKDLEARNLIVPVVGNFGGPHSLRAIGAFLREHAAVVTAFYLSNVEQYLHQDFIWDAFCANVASMPLDEHSTFIRSTVGGRNFGFGTGFTNYLGPMRDETRRCVETPADGATR
jgi:hypothetical protein